MKLDHFGKSRLQPGLRRSSFSCSETNRAQAFLRTAFKLVISAFALAASASCSGVGNANVKRELYSGALRARMVHLCYGCIGFWRKRRDACIG